MGLRWTFDVVLNGALAARGNGVVEDAGLSAPPLMTVFSPQA